MKSSSHRVTEVALGVIVLSVTLTLGCPRDEATPPPETPRTDTAAKVSKADAQVFAPLKVPTDELSPPVLLSEYHNVDETTCVQPIENVRIGAADSATHNLVKENARGLREVLRTWISERLVPDAVSSTDIERWTIIPDDVVTKSVGESEIRFVEEGPECIDPQSGGLRAGSTLAVEFFGARTFHFTTKIPVDGDTARSIRNKCGELEMRFETSDLEDYEPVKNEEGQHQKNEKGERLYRTASGATVSEKSITTPERQKMTSWSITTKEPVYFAYREISNRTWNKEFDPDNCNVNLIWGDPTFRPSECPEASSASFAIAEKEGRVEVKIKAGTVERTEVIGYDREQMVQVDDRTILWITPSKIEEGALLKVNSLVLSPMP